MGDLVISNLTNNKEEIVEKEVKEIVEVKPKKNKEIDTTVKDLCGLIFLYITIQDTARRSNCNATCLDMYTRSYCNATRLDMYSTLALFFIGIYGSYIIHFRK